MSCLKIFEWDTMTSYIFVILVAGQTVFMSCGILEILNAECKPNVVCGVLDESLSIRWRLKTENNEDPDFNILQICPDNTYKNCFASGGIGGFTVKKNTVFGDRIDAEFDDGIYTFTISNLNKSDEKHTLYVLAGFKESLAGNTKVKTRELKIEVNAYPKLIQPLASTLYFNETDTPTVNIVTSGIPKPTVAWRFHDKIISGTDINNSNDEYTYEVIIPQLTKQSCGYELHYLISGWNNSMINFTSTVYVNFTPVQPVVTVTERTENNIVVSWHQLDYGLCSVNYTVVVFNVSQMVVKSIQATKPPVEIIFSSRDEGINATIVKVTASYRGKQSSDEKEIPLTFVPPTATTTTKKGAGVCINESCGIGNLIGVLMGGLVAGIIIGITMTILSQRFINKKREEKNKASSMENLDYDNVIAQQSGASGINSPESNYTALNMSNVPTSDYTELQSSQNKTYVNMQQEYEILPKVR